MHSPEFRDRSPVQLCRSPVLSLMPATLMGQWPPFELLARNDMREMCLATPAVSGDLLLVRTRTHIHALRKMTSSAARFDP
jgi:hypothetical protein